MDGKPDAIPITPMNIQRAYSYGVGLLSFYFLLVFYITVSSPAVLFENSLLRL